MKKIILLVSFLIITTTSIFSQSNKEEVELYQSIFGMEKKAITSSFIQLDGEQAIDFWTLYDEYETARKINGQKRINLLVNYADQYLELDDAKTDLLVSESIKLNNAQNKLITKYYKKIKKATGSKSAAQFIQLENYFQSMVRTTLLEEIPFIGELDD